ncbi:TerB N-terminal domain-containing protein [Gracilimonas tropica]|uniref:tellurite resistance TerB family protein n=1 Tax=Gracilimonas tropica TaxID=454600 RepID=UPI001B7FBC7C|nr:TerB N-terminal domain-containing protein [Gracilimonas tropica]
MLVFLIIIVIAVILINANADTKNQIQPRQNYRSLDQRNERENNSRFISSYDHQNVDLSDKPDKFWRPKSEQVEVNGYSFPKGFVYVGNNLSSVSKNYYGSNIEPALIDTTKRIDKINPDLEGDSLSYWPSYQSITPQARAAYLHWLEQGLDTADVPIGYVFLYFYGIERRILNDSQISELAKSEIPELVAEVKRLLSIYGGNNSFSRYANSLVEFVELSQNAKQSFLESLSKEDLDYENYVHQYEYSLNFKMGLAYFALKDIPLPAEWALKWGIINNHSIRTPARRCKDKFQILFKKKYKDLYEEGIKLKPNKTYIKTSYRTASRSFGNNNFNAKTNIPDITALSSPLNKIRALIDECTELLDPYSRHLGRNPDDKNSIDALSKLPDVLINEVNDSKVETIINKLDSALEENEYTLIESSFFTDLWEIDGVNKFRKKEAISIAQIMQGFGFGIEPDIRFGYHKIDKEGKIAVFNIDKENTPKKPTKEYKLVLPIIHMTALVGLADGIFKPEEEKHFEEYIESLLYLSDQEKKRINGYLYWLKSAEVNVAHLKSKIERLADSDKTKIIEYLISLAWADHHIHPDEVSMLQKVADMFGIDESKVLKKLYDLQHGEEDELVEVTTKSNSNGHKIPKEKQSSGLLNEELLQARIDQTNEVQSILSDVFEEEDDESTKNIESSNEEDDFTSYLGLDKQHSQLVGKLISKEVWTQDEFDRLCSEIGLMPNGAIEIINEKSFDKHEDDLLLLYEELEINEYISDKL